MSLNRWHATAYLTIEAVSGKAGIATMPGLPLDHETDKLWGSGIGARHVSSVRRRDLRR
jgi:hypothetical protein